MLWMLADGWSVVGRFFGYGLMIAGGATCVWMPLSRFAPLASKKVYGIICCALLLVTAAAKVMSDPPAAQANAAETSTPSVAHGTSALASSQPAIGSIWPDPNGTSQPVHPAAKPQVKKPADDLGDRYTDLANGFSIRFPGGWTSRTFSSGDPWFIDVSDGKSGLISVGFVPFPSSAGIEQLRPKNLATHLTADGHTHITGQATSTIDGHKGLWFRYNARLDFAGGPQTVQVIHYFVPLHDSRMLELRLAAPPDKFSAVTPLLRKSVQTLKLTP